MRVQKLPNPGKAHGTELSVVIEGQWTHYRAYLLRYLRQIAVITPYAQFAFRHVTADGAPGVAMTFARRTDVMPTPPQQVRRAGLWPGLQRSARGAEMSEDQVEWLR